MIVSLYLGDGGFPIGAHGEEGPADGLWGRALLSSMPENVCLTNQLYLTCC